MNKHELFKLFRQWRDNGESEKIVAAIIALPEPVIDDDILNWLTEAYIDIGEYKKAIAVLDSQHSRLENDYRWYFRMGLALFHASEDEECEDDDELRANILERASATLARGMNMNPPEEALSTADMYMERIEDALAEINGEDDEDETDIDELDLYDEEELDALEDHIKEYFGDFPTVFHEIASPDIHCDVYIVPPRKDRNYYTLITMGMGARYMDIPDDLDPSEYGRAELLICLPPDWKVGENKEEWFWPISLLKGLSRLPINCESWLGWGHSVDNRQAFAENTELCGSLLLHPEDVEDGAESCTLPNGDKVNFFEVIPIYREEMNFKIDNGTKALLEQMSQVRHIVDINRPNCCEDYRSDAPDAIDCVEDHSKKIAEKELPLDPICGANHIAAFMRWCIERRLIAPEFYEHCGKEVEGVLSGEKTDLREFILDYFDGELSNFQLSFLGVNFADYYYNWKREDPQFFFPADVDAYAEEYFGTEKYNSEEFKDEAYLFVPFDEKYYQGLSKFIDRAFFTFYPSFADYQYRLVESALTRIRQKYNFKGEAVRHYSSISEDLAKKKKAMSGTGISLAIIFLEGGEAVTDSELLEDILRKSFDPYLALTAFVEVPENDLITWLADMGLKYLGDTPENENLKNISQKAQELFGLTPLIITFDEERTTLFVPYTDHTFAYFSGEGLPFLNSGEL